MTVRTASGEGQSGENAQRRHDRPARPPTAAVPPSYPDPESWRRFGLLRRQLRRPTGSHALTSEPTRE
jgi:hypothetical protein